jgi:hypothetical protein
VSSSVKRINISIYLKPFVLMSHKSDALIDIYIFVIGVKSAPLISRV